MRLLLCVFLALTGLTTDASGQGLNAEELDLQRSCKNGVASACEDLQESIRTRVESGERVEMNAGEMLFDQCAAGIRSACIRLRILNDLRAERGEDPIISSPSATPSPASEPIPEPIPVPAPVSEDSSGWRWFWMLLGGFFAYRFVVVLGRYIRDGPPPEPTTITPPLPLPAIWPGPRNGQGDLAKFGPVHRQLTPWDQTWIFNWLDEQLAQTRPLVTDTTYLELCDSLEPASPNTSGVTYAAVQYLTERNMQDAGKTTWSDPKHRYFQLQRARQNHVAGAYVIANTLWHDGIDVDPRVIVHLFRLDADKDFNPSAVNLHGIMNSKQLKFTEDLITGQEMELYLRYFFLLGAPDGHFHITTQILTFYLYVFGGRDDEGFVAAGMQRIKKYYDYEYRDWRDRCDTHDKTWNLDDTRISPDGMMYDEAQKERSVLQ